MKDNHYKTTGLIKKLHTLGLNEKEAKVYLDLLAREQPIGTSKIVRSTGLYGQNVYDALAGLEEKGLATHVIVGTRKKFAATNPSRLELLAEYKKKLALEVVRDLSIHVRANHFQDFEFYQGDDAFLAHEFSELSDAKYGEEWLILGGSGDRFESIIAHGLRDYDSIRQNKNIRMRYIGSEAQREDLQRASKSRPFFGCRILPNFQKSIVNTLVRPQSLSLSTYGDPVLTYQIKNLRVAESYRNFFEALWSVGLPL